MSKLINKNTLLITIITVLSFLFGFGLYLFQVFNLRSDPLEIITENSVGLELNPIAKNLKIPWSAGFTSENRMIITERPGSVRLVIEGKLQEKPLHVFDEVKSESEEGLMGVAVDPDYSINKYLYFMYAYIKDLNLKIKVIRMTDLGQSLTSVVTLIDGIEATQNHAGGRLAFGPDKKLYITTGDAINLNYPLDLKSLNGKILRINTDGTVPDDNPFPNSLIWSYGHRNSQGLAWDSRNGNLLSTEHGPSLFDGPAGGDELNLIKKGAKYGWPTVSHNRKLEGAEAAQIVFNNTIAPSGIVFYTGEEFPQLKNSFIFAGLAGKGIYQVKQDSNNPNNYNDYQKISSIKVGRVRDIVQSPEGKLYILTSNTDYRGVPNPNDDKIYQLIIKK